MSLIGTLEQIDVKSVLRRVEIHAKTGLFVVKQGAQWVEMYFRGGRLMWVGPAHIQVDLGEWLLQNGVVSAQAWQEVMRSIGTIQRSEMRVALTLMDLGYVEHDQLRAWAAARARRVLTLLSTWTTGEMYFEDDIAPSADYLLVAVSIVALFATNEEASTPAEVPMQMPRPASTVSTVSAPIAKSVPVSNPIPAVQATASVSRPSAHVSNAPTLMESSQFFSSQERSTKAAFPVDDLMANLGIVEQESAIHPQATATSTASSSASHHVPSALRLVSDAPEGEPTQLIPSASIPLPTTPMVAPKRVDTDFMQPHMLLVPANLSALCEQNTLIQLTPHQWRLLTLVDGKTSLQEACQALSMQPQELRQVAGELIALRLIRVVSPVLYQNQTNEMPRHLREVAKGDSGSNYVTVSSGTASVGFPAPLPVADVVSQYSPALPYATQSQWGNGGNNATFVPGRGWVMLPQPPQPLQTSGPIALGRTAVYAGSGQ